MDVTVTIISSLLSGALGVAASTYYYRRYERRKQRFELFKTILGTRYALTDNAPEETDRRFFEALNQVVVIFHDSPPVIEAIKAMHRELGVPNRNTDNLVSLLKAMAKNLKINIEGLNDDFYMRPFISAAPRVRSGRV